MRISNRAKLAFNNVTRTPFRTSNLSRAAWNSLACGASLGCSVLGFAPSGLPGPKGNLETFAWLGEAGRAGALADVDATLAEVAV